ncbi:hypothetical protein C8R43DRAFT_946541 [Mycena crocata]|nr:hypothetical protein C8R43DRAFT_946541 [Mycena crocata]
MADFFLQLVSYSRLLDAKETQEFVMPAMSLVLWTVLLFATRAVDADFHILNCVSTGSSANSISTNLTIVVPATDLGSCPGILGHRAVTLEDLTQPVGTIGKFSINNFCGSRRLDVYLASDLMGIFFSGGDGTLNLGQCSPSPGKYSSQALSLDCSDAEGNVITAQLPISFSPSVWPAVPNSSSASVTGTQPSPTSNLSVGNGGMSQNHPSSWRAFWEQVRWKRKGRKTTVQTTLSPKTPGPISSTRFMGGNVRNEYRDTLQSRSRSQVMLSHPEPIPPSYYGEEDQHPAV